MRLGRSLSLSMLEQIKEMDEFRKPDEKTNTTKNTKKAIGGNSEVTTQQQSPQSENADKFIQKDKSKVTWRTCERCELPFYNSTYDDETIASVIDRYIPTHRLRQSREDRGGNVFWYCECCIERNEHNQARAAEYKGASSSGMVPPRPHYWVDLRDIINDCDTGCYTCRHERKFTSDLLLKSSYEFTQRAAEQMEEHNKDRNYYERYPIWRRLQAMSKDTAQRELLQTKINKLKANLSLSLKRLDKPT